MVLSVKATRDERIRWAQDSSQSDLSSDQAALGKKACGLLEEHLGSTLKVTCYVARLCHILPQTFAHREGDD